MRDIKKLETQFKMLSTAREVEVADLKARLEQTTNTLALVTVELQASRDNSSSSYLEEHVKTLMDQLQVVEDNLLAERKLVNTMNEEFSRQTQADHDELTLLTEKLHSAQNNLSREKSELEKKIHENGTAVSGTLAAANSEQERLREQLDFIQKEYESCRAFLIRVQEDASNSTQLLQAAQISEKALQENLLSSCNELNEAKEQSSRQQQEIQLLEKALNLSKKVYTEQMESIGELKEKLLHRDSSICDYESCKSDLLTLKNEKETMLKELDTFKEV